MQNAQNKKADFVQNSTWKNRLSIVTYFYKTLYKKLHKKETKKGGVTMNLPEKMKALVAYGKGNYRLETDYPVPECGDDDIIIKTEACGICAGDLKCMHGAERFWGNGENPSCAEPRSSDTLHIPPSRRCFPSGIQRWRGVRTSSIFRIYRICRFRTVRSDPR